MTVEFLKHTLEHPNMIVCPLACGEVFSSREYYLRQRVRPCWRDKRKKQIPAAETSSPAEGTISTDTLQVEEPATEAEDHTTDHEHSVDGEYNSEPDLTEFFTALHEGNCSQKAQDLAALQLQGIFDTIRTKTKEAAMKGIGKIRTNLLAAASLELSNFVNEEEIMEDIVESASFFVPDNVKTQYRREKAMGGTGGRVSGNMIEVPSTFERPGKTTRRGFALQYHRPIRKVLLEMAKSEEHLCRWRAPFEQRKETHRWQNTATERVHHTPMHGDVAVSIKEELGTDRNIIFLEIYSDDVTHTGGNRNTNDSTVTHSYFAIVNVAGPDSRGPTYWHSHHFCLPKDYENKDEEKQYGMVVKDLRDLVANDLVLPSGERFKVRLLTLSGDQKELHTRLGLVSHFMAEYTDRFTYATMQKRINCKSSTQLEAVYSTKRTDETTQPDITRTEQEKKPIRGHIRRPLLETVPNYKPFGPGGTSACVSHDLHTGINKYDMSLSFRTMILKGWTTIQELNKLITTFKDKLAGEDSDNYPGNINLSLSGNSVSIQGNMAQTKTLARFMPLILKPILDRHPELKTHAAWNVITGLAALNAGWSSFAISQSQLDHLEQAYKTYLDQRYTLVTTLLTLTKTTLEENRKRQVYTDIKPKHGTLLSYPRLTKQLGALAYYSTLPAEQKNGKMKKKMKEGNCYKNIIKSLGKQANTKEKFTPSYTPPVDSIVPLRAAARAALPQEAKHIIEAELGDRSYSFCEKANLHNVPHIRNQAVAYYTTDKCDSFHIGTVEALILSTQSGDMKISILARRQNHHEIPEFQCYALEPTTTLDYVDTQDLATHSPCNKLQMGGRLGTVITFPATPTVLNKKPFGN